MCIVFFTHMEYCSLEKNEMFYLIKGTSVIYVNYVMEDLCVTLRLPQDENFNIWECVETLCVDRPSGGPKRPRFTVCHLVFGVLMNLFGKCTTKIHCQQNIPHYYLILWRNIKM